MSEFDRALTKIETHRAREEAARQRRIEAAAAFLKSFYERDIKASKKLKEYGIEVEFDGRRLVLERPGEGQFSEGLMIAVGEQGEIDVGGKSLGKFKAGDETAKKGELIGEIISHFSL
jgi:hypothetical protein